MSRRLFGACLRALKPRFARSKVTVHDLEVDAAALDVKAAGEIYREHGCLVVRGLNLKYVKSIVEAVEYQAKQSVQLLDRKKAIPEGWMTDDGTLFIPAPDGYSRKEQIMVLGTDYYTCANLLAASMDDKCLDICQEILGPSIELFGKGQIVYKEPMGGHAKFMHQDSAYFEFAKGGPVGTLNYCIDTNLTLNNGPLYVAPGSHKDGHIEHIDTHSHLALENWPFEKAIPVEGKAGDTIFFHIHTIHGSKNNLSSKPRPVFINRYLASNDYVIFQATTVENRKEAEERILKEGHPKVKNRGYMVRGWRQYEGKAWDFGKVFH
ncbi:L-proline trans-4-hydroxylase-like [Oscarella lobularis]|uniref:L-proline trans-4-hydroxylase-like n=1 Tax=Oscarella lobularis TaxID=121494 RepID=UPI0033130BAE